MKKAILSCLMLMAGLSVSAQEQKGTTAEGHDRIRLRAALVRSDSGWCTVHHR